MPRARCGKSKYIKIEQRLVLSFRSAIIGLPTSVRR